MFSNKFESPKFGSGIKLPRTSKNTVLSNRCALLKLNLILLVLFRGYKSFFPNRGMAKNS